MLSKLCGLLVFFNYPPRAESCTVVGGVWGCFLWGSYCRSRFPSAYSFQHLYTLHSTPNSTAKTQFQATERRKLSELTTPVVSCPLLNFLCARESQVKKTWRILNVLSSFPTVNFQFSNVAAYEETKQLCLSGVDLVTEITDLCNSRDFHWWSSENLSLVNLISSYLCSGIIWWVDRWEVQQQESSIAYSYFTWKRGFWVPLETSLLSGLSIAFWYITDWFVS